MECSQEKMENPIQNIESLELNIESHASKKLTYEDLSLMILMAAKEWMSANEISTKVGRSSKYLKNTILPRMIEEQLLEVLFPSVPKHPKQSYRAKDDITKDKI